MATIYGDQHIPLKSLLAQAGKSDDATLLIPDLQRPYVWHPSQVILLVDSLIRGWPFGTLLTWKVKSDDPARALARSFWRIVDRVGDEDGQPISMKNPPAAFHMVLDGQQRIQSLLLALGGDGWGFKLFDRQWHEYLNGIRARGPRGKPHWSLGCLCVDITLLNSEYQKHKRATSVDYAKVLNWVVTDTANGQSQLAKPPTYSDPLPNVSKQHGQFLRLARLWEAAPDHIIDNYEAEDIAEKLLNEHGVPPGKHNELRRAIGALVIALREVKQTRVTYLELSEYESAHGDRDVYNDAIVNIFTRLNTAGRTLTREDITFAWLKIGWDASKTQNASAKACIDSLAEELFELELPLAVEDVISAVSFIWSSSFASGKLLTNNDLMRGEAIRPMAEHVSRHWHLVVEATTQISGQAKDRGLRFREHYQSLNALSYLWAWYFVALKWSDDKKLSVINKDTLTKRLGEVLDKYMDRWLICSQWAGVWSSSSSAILAKYAAALASCAEGLKDIADVDKAVVIMAKQLQVDLRDLEQPAITYISSINADDRNQARAYYTALWMWNRLDKERWCSAQIVLRQRSRRKNTFEVDHIVPYDLWNKKLNAEMNSKSDMKEKERLKDLGSRVNDLGNCMLLEKTSTYPRATNRSLHSCRMFTSSNRTRTSLSNG